jgi:hypothetical protein
MRDDQRFPKYELIDARFPSMKYDAYREYLDFSGIPVAIKVIHKFIVP